MKIKVLESIPQIMLDDSFVYEVNSTFASMKEVKEGGVIFANINGYMHDDTLDYISTVELDKSHIKYMEDDSARFNEMIDSGNYSDDEIVFFKEHIKINTKNIADFKKYISIYNQAIKEDAIRNSDNAVHLNGNSGFSPLDLLGEWTISFINDEYVSVGSSNDLNVIRLTERVLPMVPKAN